MAAGPYNYSYIFKYIIIGDMGVGKSCLLHQFTEKKCTLKLVCIYVLILNQFLMVILDNVAVNVLIFVF